MNYIVWQKIEFAEDWHRYDACNEEELTEVILDRTRHEGEIVVSLPIEYSITVKVSKVPADVVPVETVKPVKPDKVKIEEVKGETGQS